MLFSWIRLFSIINGPFLFTLRYSNIILEWLNYVSPKMRYYCIGIEVFTFDIFRSKPMNTYINNDNIIVSPRYYVLREPRVYCGKIEDFTNS